MTTRLTQVANAYERLARRERDRGRLSTSRTYIERGLTVIADHPPLLTLREEVRAKIEEEERQRAEKEQQRREIAKLLEQAARQLAEGQLTEPATENAWETYREILRLAPGNEAARRGLERIAAEYQHLSQQNLAAGNVASSLKYAEAGLKVMPKDKQLLALYDEAQAKLDEAKLHRRMEELEPQQEVARLTADARSKRSDYRRVERKLDAEEQALHLLIQHILVRKRAYLRGPSPD